MNIRTALLLASPSAFLALAPPSSAQVTFSVDDQSPTITDTPIGVGRPITSGDILSPIGGVPQIPANGQALQTPEILVGIGNSPGLQGALRVNSGDGCIGVFPGDGCQAELDALTFGHDDLVESFGTFLGVTASTEKGHWHFSVDEYAVGVPGLGADPSVESENRAVATVPAQLAGDSCADIFVNLEFPFAPPLGPAAAAAGNIAVADGDGFPSLSSYTVYPALGLKEPNAPLAPPGANPGDNLDALDCDGMGFPGVSFPIYYSLDSGFFDPKGLAANSGTAAANGFSGADILTTATMGALPTIYASAASLGLDQDTIDSDDVDALIIGENGVPGFQPSLTPYDWLDPTSPTDMVFFSVRRDSAITNNPLVLDSIFGVEIEPGDILVPPVSGGNGNPGIFIAAEVLGLRTLRNFDPCGDDLDAMDFKVEDKLIYQEYCFGDGGVAVPGTGTSCRPCPCGNEMPPGSLTGCENSSGTGAHLQVSGIPSVSADTLRFEVSGASPSTFGLLVHGGVRLPAMGLCAGTGLAQPTQLDGLRCVGMTQRAGTRPSNAIGEIGVTTSGWGPPDAPPVGIIAQGGLVSCQVRQFMVIYRDDPLLVCNNALNTSNGVQVTILP